MIRSDRIVAVIARSPNGATKQTRVACTDPWIALPSARNDRPDQADAAFAAIVTALRAFREVINLAGACLLLFLARYATRRAT